MANKSISIIIFSLSVFLAFSIASAETITLKSGKRVDGEILEKTEEHIIIDFKGGKLTYFLDEIESIDGKSLVAEENNDIKEPLTNSQMDSEDLKYLASQYLALGELDKSILYASKALPFDKNGSAYQILGTDYLFKKDFENATLNYKKLLEKVKIGAQELIDAKADDPSYKFGFGTPDPREFSLMMLGPAYENLYYSYLTTGRKDKARELMDDYERFIKLLIVKTDNSKSESLAAFNTGIKKDLSGLDQMKNFISEADSEKMRLATEQNKPDFASLLQKQIESNESNITANLRVLSVACQAYRASKSTFPEQIPDLCKDNYLETQRLCVSPEEIKIYGYRINYMLKGRDNFVLTANPIIPGKTGNREFSIDQTGDIVTQ